MRVLIKTLLIIGTFMILLGIVIDVIQRECYNLPLNDYFKNNLCRLINE